MWALRQRRVKRHSAGIHSAATNLVSRGDILHAQSRLGHADAATTLRVYSHAMPLTDADAAAVLEKLYLW